MLFEAQPSLDGLDRPLLRLALVHVSRARSCARGPEFRWWKEEIVRLWLTIGVRRLTAGVWLVLYFPFKSRTHVLSKLAPAFGKLR